MADTKWYYYLTPYIQYRDKIKKLACIFAGLGHLQPLLLATTNANYLLDRFCMERCCSSEYISRIVTSIIFMEILAIILVRIVLLTVLGNSTIWGNWQGDNATGKKLNEHNEDEERWRGVGSCIILFFIFLGYIQILCAFLSGGKKGHMEWFYASLLIQHLLNSLIAGSIGFWEVGLALWYLVTLPMAPIIVFFYQLIIHSWIRNNGPRYQEYIIVECQIVLATALSFIATIFWILAYFKPYVPIELEINDLNNQTSPDGRRITKEDITLHTLAPANSTPVTGNGQNLTGSDVQSVELSTYSLTLTTLKYKESGGSATKYDVTTRVEAELKIVFSATAGDNETVTVTSAKIIEQPKTLKLTTQGSSPPNPELKVYSSNVQPKSGTPDNSVTLSLNAEAEGTIESSNLTITNLEVTIPVEIKVVVKTTRDAQDEKAVQSTLPIESVILKLPVPTTTDANKPVRLIVDAVDPGPNKTLNIEVTVTAGDSNAQAQFVTASGKGFSPTPGYCIYSVREGGNANKDIWADIGGKCTFAACYKKTSDTTPALLMLYLRTPGDTLKMKYFGTENVGSAGWKEITKAKFFYNLPELAKGTLNLSGGTATPQYNRIYHPTSWWSHTMAPLIMQGLSVGAVGSIFPNLIPKTLVCPKTTRTLSVINMFMVTVPHIFNVMLGDMDLLSRIGVGAPWEDTGHGWPCSLLLYLIYALAILFAIFNIHYPEWALSSFLRNNTWMVFLMILFTDVLNETFNAISRAGICSQRSAGGTKKNHPCLHNKIACLMNLTYIPFWMTTTPMIMGNKRNPLSSSSDHNCLVVKI